VGTPPTRRRPSRTPSFARGGSATRSLPTIAATRGVGLFLGVDIVDDKGQPSSRLAGRIVNALRDDRILISATGRLGHTLKIRPPLVFTESHAVMLVEGLERALRHVAQVQ